MNMFLPFYIRIYLKASDHTKILIQFFTTIGIFPSSSVSRAEVSLHMGVNKAGVRFPANLAIFSLPNIK